MTGISRKLPDKERQRLKKLLREIVPPEHGVIVRTAAEGATEEQLRADVERLTKSWEDIQERAKNYKSAPALLKGEPELAVRVVRDIFNEDFSGLTVQGDTAWRTISAYVQELSPELFERLHHWTSKADIFAEHRVDEQLAKAFDRKVWLPSGGTLIIDRTEAMTVIDVNTGKFTGSGGTLEETVTRNNLEAAEEIVRQLRLRDIGGIIVVDFIDMVLESNRELVLRRLVECLGRDRTRHQVAEVTSLGLIQMTRKRVGQGLVEAFSTPCEVCEGRGFITHTHPVEKTETSSEGFKRKRKNAQEQHVAEVPDESKRDEVRHALNSIAAAAAKEHDTGQELDGTANSADTSVVAEGAAKETPSGAEKGHKQRHSNGRKATNGQKKSARKNSNSRGEMPRTSGEVIKVEPAKGELVKAPVAEDATTTVASKPRARRVSSAGTITPGSGTGAILSFPAQ
jgi:ribonuclease E